MITCGTFCARSSVELTLIDHIVVIDYPEYEGIELEQTSRCCCQEAMKTHGGN